MRSAPPACGPLSAPLRRPNTRGVAVIGSASRTAWRPRALASALRAVRSAAGRARAGLALDAAERAIAPSRRSKYGSGSLRAAAPAGAAASATAGIATRDAASAKPAAPRRRNVRIMWDLGLVPAEPANSTAPAYVPAGRPSLSGARPYLTGRVPAGNGTVLHSLAGHWAGGAPAHLRGMDQGPGPAAPHTGGAGGRAAAGGGGRGGRRVVGRRGGGAGRGREAGGGGGGAAPRGRGHAIGG